MLKITLGDHTFFYEVDKTDLNPISGNFSVVQSTSKVKTLARIDVEKVNTINEFADTVITESRLTQGLEYLKVNNISIEPKSIPVFLKWISDDVVKEETDTLVASNLEIKDVMTRVKYVARNWFLTQEEM